ncbi:N-acetylglucosamine-6-phosphate deacetylase [Roseibium salinum]|uniref:N-acetylglucosamine-6-phosphate deacetylase n=1 Tax=Roseibium salinum TaxID=1604349 RepID=A0ABT3R1A5_9HYPH|nr:N-acetylglucosamine-6-phosphate deacetylase [Roseibium sp. DSM 29163]MCX2722858.1 N-acetylglucosamine-6-phosphate deacetylase [Roseibium sp. DSM 29163]MDN3719212.1 N-acetylglucosamine-6-phosphate deacetylase [Roseibium salinum]
MTGMTAYRCSRIFDGEKIHRDAALLVEGGVVAGLCPVEDLPGAITSVDLGEGVLSPGLIDLQVNGGGGLMLGDARSVEDIARICVAHLQLGSTALTPTLITDTPETTRRIIDLAIDAWTQGVPGFHGLHLEGPHLFVGRKGAHDASLIRPMTDEDLDLYISAARQLPSLMMTLAPETVDPGQIASLVGAGIHVSLGHSGASYAECRKATEAGASCVTHLFNAMSPLQHREPGLVGAALDLGALNAGLIADGIHVDPAAIRIALKSKTGPGRIFLVTDAMSQTGTDVTSFTLGNREIFRRNGMLTLADGTLAGADIDLPSSLKYLTSELGVGLETALAMATSYPADVIRLPLGRFKEGCAADFVLLSEAMAVMDVWLSGTSQQHSG